MATLRHLGRISIGCQKIETPVGVVEAILKEDGSVQLQNVPSYLQQRDVCIDVDGVGKVEGDIAWGGNWFYLVNNLQPELKLANVESLTDISWRIRRAINQQGFPEVDHIELFGPGLVGGDSRNFVLCPGKAYDRSPCGTGTSAKLACLASRGKLAENQTWIQESILGSQFRGWYRWESVDRHRIIPYIEGRAFVNADATLIFDPQDSFTWGIRA
jgi:4-hydroxyproline epimerase